MSWVCEILAGDGGRRSHANYSDRMDILTSGLAEDKVHRQLSDLGEISKSIFAPLSSCWPAGWFAISWPKGKGILELHYYNQHDEMGGLCKERIQCEMGVYFSFLTLIQMQ